MTIIFKDFKIRGIDISKFNDNSNTEKLPDLSKLTDKGLSFVAVRVGYGRVRDGLFDYYWKYLKKLRIARQPYFYLDYYSHKSIGYTPAEWGKIQADFAYDVLKDDPGECPLALDEENSPSYGYKVTIFNSGEYNIISRAFFERWYALTKQRELYASPGWLNNLYKWHRNIPLWLAWYNRELTISKIYAELKRLNWTGKPLILQYASDGDIDNDGTGDGLEFGFEYSTLDLNVWLGTEEEWSARCGLTQPVIEIIPEDAVEIVVPPAYSLTEEVGVMMVTCTSGLNIRNVPIGFYDSKVIGWVSKGSKVEILDIRIVDKSIWARVGQAQWMAIKYNGITYME